MKVSLVLLKLLFFNISEEVVAEKMLNNEDKVVSTVVVFLVFDEETLPGNKHQSWCWPPID